MQKYWKQRTATVILAVFGVIGTTFWGQAQETTAPSVPVQKLITPVESMINKNLYVFGYINVEAIDIDVTVENWKKLVTVTFEAVKKNEAISAHMAETGDDLDEMLAVYMASIDENLLQATAIIEPFREAGLKEIYVLANSRSMAVAPVRIVAILKENTAPDTLLAMMKQINPGMGNLSIEQREGMLIFTPSSPQFDMSNPADAARIKQMFDGIKPEANPAIIEGLERIKGAPVQFVFVPDSSIRGIMTMGLAAAPKPADKFGGKTLTDGVKWVSLGVDPMKQILALTIQSASAEAAQKLYDSTIEAIDAGITRAKAYMPEDDAGVEIFFKIAENMKDFVPKVKDDRLQLVINRSFLEPRLGTIGAMFIPAVSASGEAARRMQCTNNIKQIMLAIHNYHDANRGLPPYMTADTASKPLHSWRVLLLPYIEQSALYKQIRLDEPWDSEHNKQFHDKMPSIYQCPSAKGKMTGMTSYSVVVGKETAFDAPNSKHTFGKLADGTSNTVCIVERKTPVCWMDPTQEITFAKASEGINVSDDGLGSKHTKGMNIGLFDGSVHFVSETVTPAVWRAMLTCAGGESVALP